MRHPRLLRILVGVLTLATVTLVAPTPAQAASRCSTGSATVYSPTGGVGATASARVCINDKYRPTLDTSRYNYVKDQKADGYAARAWFRYYDTWYGYWATSGPFVADDTSTSTGAEIPNYGWPVENVDQAEVWVCLGMARPGYGSEDRCSIVAYVEYYE
ncbi:hypothetical protein ACGFIE_08740 [Micromonospora sp. NPDC049275]|uniref:hypothetical protein n=1 Tax=Micromonospora sp. NPDC049275 TaxID=3364268 RepID=UPI00371E8267